MDYYDKRETSEERYHRLVTLPMELQRQRLSERPRQLTGDHRDMEWLEIDEND